MIKSRRRSRLATIVAYHVLVVIVPETALCQDIEKTGTSELGGPNLKEIFRFQWDSIDTIQLHVEEIVFDDRGNLNRIQIFDFAMGSEARRAMSISLYQDGELKGRGVMREDGRRRYQTRQVYGHPEVTESVSIRHQLSKPDTYEGGMSVALWAFMPGGRSLATWVAEGERVDQPKRSTDESALELTTTYNEHPLRMQFDRDHDWLPFRIVLETVFEIHVHRFAEDNGRWFPAEGEMKRYETGGAEETTRFTVSDLRINRKIDPALFGMPRVPDGAQIIDEINETERIQGTRADRRKFIERYRYRPSPTSEPAVDQPIVAPQSLPDGTPWSLILGGGALAVFAAAWIYKQRRTE